MFKELIFISHATPQDNEFVRWLAAKLELAGYRVWHDLDRLKGGDYFWDKIEKAIRQDCFRLLAVVSHNSVDKPGVKDEWALGQTLEKTIPGFVIPIRIDDYDFSMLPIGIHRKNVVDFAQGWHKGLAGLLDTLFDAQAPSRHHDPRGTVHWLPELKNGAIAKIPSGEKLDSTWLAVLSMPPALETARFLGKEREIAVTDYNRHLPWFEHEDRIVGFAKSADLVSMMAKSARMANSNCIDLESFISGKGVFGGNLIPGSEARRRVVNLMRQAWELALETKGLGIHIQSGNRRVYYVPPQLTGGRGGLVPFVDVDGRARKKALNGRSEKRKANWHYAIGTVPSLDEPRRIELRPTIVFTDDNDRPFEAARAQRLRLGFCRNWWNDRWRSFLRVFLKILSEGQPEIRLPVGSGRFMIVDASPLAFSSPVSLTDAPPSVDSDVFDESDGDASWEDATDDEFEDEN